MRPRRIAALKDEATATAPVMSGTLAPAVETVTEEIEAFDLAAVKLTGQLQQRTKPAIKDIGDMLEVSGVQAGAAVVPWGFFADEVSTDVPDAMDIVMDSIMEVPPTAEEGGSAASRDRADVGADATRRVGLYVQRRERRRDVQPSVRGRGRCPGGNTVAGCSGKYGPHPGVRDSA